MDYLRACALLKRTTDDEQRGCEPLNLNRAELLESGATSFVVVAGVKSGVVSVLPSTVGVVSSVIVDVVVVSSAVVMRMLIVSVLVTVSPVIISDQCVPAGRGALVALGAFRRHCLFSGGE